MGEILGDRYRLGEPLGRGGMATVYRAEDRVLGREVAVKVLAERYASDPSFVERFKREAQAAARLSHPNVVPVFDTGEDGGVRYIVMELVDGMTLDVVLAREGRLSPERAARIGSAAARALEAAHSEGLVHRDVKPGNVMLTPSGEVRVMDFGIARAASDDTLTQTGTVIGTAAYLSPEQARGDRVDHRSDIYSLGCVLYEMLAGAPPFAEGSPVSVAYQHVNDQPSPPSKVSPAVPAELEAVVMTALAKHPSARYDSAGEMASALADAGSGSPTEPLGPGNGTEVMPVASGAGRSRWPVVAGLVAALILLATIIAFLFDGDEERRGRRGLDRNQASGIVAQDPVNLAQAITALEDLVDRAVRDGQISEEAGGQILAQAFLAADAHASGEADGFPSLQQAHEIVDARLADGGITSIQTAGALHTALDVIEAAMADRLPVFEEESPPPEDEDEDGGGGGPGNSENAPGHNKDDSDD